MILLNHVVLDSVIECSTCEDITGTYQSAAGNDLVIEDASSAGYTINGVATADGLADLYVSNGKVGVITDILLPPPPPASRTIWDVVNDDPARFSTFISVATTTGIDSYYMADGEKTLFVPTNEAFEAILPSGLLDKYFDTELWTASFLNAVLAFHDIPGTVLSTDLVNGTEIFPFVNGGLLGSSLTVTLPPPMLSAASMPVPANIFEPDLTADNGVVHVVDQVLTPSFVRLNAVEAAAVTGSFNILLELATIAGLNDLLSGPGPFTVFAPPDDVFNAYGEDFINDLREDPDRTREVLSNHLLLDFILPCCRNVTDVYETALGSELTIEDLGSSGGYVIKEGNAFTGDVSTAPGLSGLLISNGVISVITDILIPPSS